MSAKHTPGPWAVEGPMGEDHPWIVEAGRPTYEWRCIASVTADGDEIGPLEGMANARLIAAAPDLLKVCKAAKKFLESDLVEPGRTLFWALVDAIKKSEGAE